MKFPNSTRVTDVSVVALLRSLGPPQYGASVVIEEAWARIESWLVTQASVTARHVAPAASPEVLEAAAHAGPVVWPDELLRWYSMQNGETMNTLWRCTLPTWAMLSLDDMARERLLHTEAADAVDEAPDQAGEPAFAFLDEFVPIGTNGCAETLFVDLRGGPRSGCVTGYFKGDADSYGPIWPSIGAMLLEVAEALEQERTAYGYYPRVVGNELSWEL